VTECVRRRVLLTTVALNVRAPVKRRRVGHAIDLSGQLDRGPQPIAHGIFEDKAAMVLEVLWPREEALIGHNASAVGCIVRQHRSIVFSNPQDPVTLVDGVATKLHLVQRIMKRCDGSVGL
jgi:hypothetical protein